MGRKLKIEDIRPSFDVFCRGKTLWFLVSGRPFLPVTYFAKPDFNVEELFPGNDGMPYLNALLARCVVENESECLPDASALLEEIDATLADLAVKAGPDGI